MPRPVCALLLVAYFAGVGAFTCSNSNANTCNALALLYTATSGSSWTYNNGWAAAAGGTATSYCTFYGVTCGGHNDVTRMCVPRRAAERTRVTTVQCNAEAPPACVCSDLSNNTLSGSIPSSLGYLTALTYLCVPLASNNWT